jgi:hypothetical protein
MNYSYIYHFKFTILKITFAKFSDQFSIEESNPRNFSLKLIIFLGFTNLNQFNLKAPFEYSLVLFSFLPLFFSMFKSHFVSSIFLSF